MTATAAIRSQPGAIERQSGLLSQFATDAGRYDAKDEFVTGNYRALQKARLMSAAVPQELGGDGLDAKALSALLRNLARSCSSTALAYSMHTHVVALLAWRWRHQKAPVDAVLRRVADEQIVLISSGGSDWLDSSGTAQRVDGGFLIDAVKGFASGVPAGSLLNTSAVYEDPKEGPMVLHFMVPLSAPEAAIEPSWRAMGMRGTGSHQVRIKNFFVPDAAISVRRPKGVWHPLFHLISMVAFPIIYSVYFGIAEAVRDEAIAAAKRRSITVQLVDMAGALETELAAARFALDEMLRLSGDQPGQNTTNAIFLARSNLVRSLLATGDKAFDVALGSGYLRTSPIERLFRDLQAARFHPLQPHAQRDLSGRLALGLPIDGALQ